MGKKEGVISKVHFQISRERCFLSSGMEDEVIYLIDLSQNGTFVNSNLIGKGNRTILVNNDLVAVAKNNFNGNDIISFYYIFYCIQLIF